MAENQKMSLASENTLETEHFMPLDYFSNFSNFRGTQHFYVILKTFFQRQNYTANVHIQTIVTL